MAKSLRAKYRELGPRSFASWYWRRRLGKLPIKYRELGPLGFARWFLLKRIGRPLYRTVDGYLGRQSLVGDPPVFDPQLFPFVAELEAGWGAVRAELDALFAARHLLPPIQAIQPDQARISPDDKWHTFVIWGYGYRSASACERCPETAKLLEKVPNLQSAWFSILAPGKHIRAHQGVTKGVIRIHLGVKVPARREQCRMQVGEHVVVWEEGRCILFDDSQRHEVWNDTDEERAVLIIDFDRPMTRRGRVVHRLLQHALRWSPFVRDAKRRVERWEERIAAASSPS
jgi:beta-hydroxylase